MIVEDTKLAFWRCAISGQSKYIYLTMNKLSHRAIIWAMAYYVQRERSKRNSKFELSCVLFRMSVGSEEKMRVTKICHVKRHLFCERGATAEHLSSAACLETAVVDFSKSE